MRKVNIYIFSFLISINICAQEQNYEAIINDNINSYLNAINNNALLYSSKIEPSYGFIIQNHPYLHKKEFMKGTISLEGRVYHNVMLRLNQEIEEIMTKPPTTNFSLLIPRDKFEYALIDSLYILYHIPESANGKLLPKGFYIRIYNGEYQVWKREIFYLTNKIDALISNYNYEKQLRIYIYKDGNYNPVKNKRSVLKLFSSKKKVLNKFIKQSGLKFSENPDKAIVAITKYYDELKK